MVATIERVHLELVVQDRDVVEELLKFPETTEQEGYALAALRVGVLAIRQASGVIDSRAMREEGERLLRAVATALTEHAKGVNSQVSQVLGRYFDPTNGELPQRLDRLLKRDGELETLLVKHVNGDGSTLAHALEQHVGANSPLLQVLSPDQRTGFLASLKQVTELMLSEHCKGIVGQFSLDDRNSALSRLIIEISEKNGSLRRDLADDLEKVRKEFSLDNGDGALSRLVGRVEGANRTILEEFSADNKDSALSKMSAMLASTNQNINASLSLDDENSPLSRLCRQLTKVIEEMEQKNREFQEQVRVSLSTLQARREEAARSTRHGITFQDAVGDFLNHEAQRINDIFEITKDTTGSMPRCKIGDFVLILGPETAAPDARIVVEAKEDKSYDIRKAHVELQKARPNRSAQVGVFVFSRSTAPAGIDALTRQGTDIFVVWDAEDLTSDVNLRAALSVARMIVVQERAASEQETADIAAMDTAIDTVVRDLALLDDISRIAGNAMTSCESVVTKANSLKKKIETQLDLLKDHVGGLAVDQTK